MGQVGIIANPASGKDIRRLVAYGTTFDNQEKVNIVRRLILGLASVGVEKIIYMPEYYGIVPGAVNTISSQHRPRMEIVPAGMCISATQEDSTLAASIMADCMVQCIITLGGDGTNRVVAKGCRDIPLLPISTGTNNVFPTMIEGTIAGLAAGAVAQGIAAGQPVISASKKLVIYKNGLPVDIALVDAVVLKDSFIGSRAVWDADRITQIIVTRGEAHNIGISSIAGNLVPITAQDDRGMVIVVGEKFTCIRVPLAPGLIETVPIKGYRTIRVGEMVEVATPCMIALDGEREIEARPEDKIQVELTFEGPKVIDVENAMRMAVCKSYSKTNR